MVEWFQGKSSRLISLILFIALLSLTLALGWTLAGQAKHYAQQVFDEQVDQLSESITLRMHDHEQLLLGAKGLFDASETVDRAEFHRYVSSLHIDKKFPGIQILGYSEWVHPADLQKFKLRIRDEGFPFFDVRPLGEREHYSAIIFMEPFASRNVAAFGYDMFSEPTRQQAMRAAVSTNSAGLSGRVILVQEQSANVQAATLLYLPIFKKNLPLTTEAERWAALQGFVYIGLRMGDLMDGLLQKGQLNMRFSLFAGEILPKELLYASGERTPSAEVPVYHANRQINLYGQSWRLLADSDLPFEQKHKFNTTYIVLTFGVVVSILLSLIFYVLVSQRQRALSIAHAMTNDMRKKNVELKHNQERFELALESSAMGVWSLHFGDNLLEWDSYMYILFGVEVEKTALTYDRFFTWIHSDDRQRVFEEIAQAIEGKIGYDTEYRVVWPDHSVHYVASRAKIIYEANEPVSMIGTCWDISERKRLDRVKTEFVSTVSHELRTPLTAITGALGLATSGSLCDLPQNAKQVLDIAYKNAQRLKSLINDLLDMDKLLAGKLEFHCEPQHILPLIERALIENKSYADQMQVRFVMEPTQESPLVNIEDNRFLQVMANFLSNAAKFSPPNSDVVVRLDMIDNFARVSVIDHGVGLDEESKSHIFEKFYQADSSDTRNKGGTGLGLAITKEIVERMQGRVGFDSELGKGSRFYAEFPVVVN